MISICGGYGAAICPGNILYIVEVVMCEKCKDGEVCIDGLLDGSQSVGVPLAPDNVFALAWLDWLQSILPKDFAKGGVGPPKDRHFKIQYNAPDCGFGDGYDPYDMRIVANVFCELNFVGMHDDDEYYAGFLTEAYGRIHDVAYNHVWGASPCDAAANGGGIDWFWGADGMNMTCHGCGKVMKVL